MTQDIFIGFERKPRGLEGFLKRQGYDNVTDRAEKPDDACQVYEHTENVWPQVFYYPRLQKEEKIVSKETYIHRAGKLIRLSPSETEKLALPEEEECPSWRKSGYDIVSELNINFHADNFEALEEAERLKEAIAKRFNGIIYDESSDEFFRGEK